MHTYHAHPCGDIPDGGGWERCGECVMQGLECDGGYDAFFGVRYGTPRRYENRGAGCVHRQILRAGTRGWVVKIALYATWAQAGGLFPSRGQMVRYLRGVE